MSQTLTIVLDFVFRLAALLFLLRFVLQASRADFYNPVSQAVVNATDTLCKPLRALLKPVGVFDPASVVVAWLLSVVSIYLLTFLQYGGAPLPMEALWAGVIKTFLILTQFYKWSIIIIVIASFVAQGTYHPALQLLQQMLEPVMGRLRNALPSLGPLDLSPMVALLVIILIEDMLMRAFI